MLRLLAWIKYADERLQFTRGLSAEDEPEARCVTIIWVSIYGLNLVCRMSAASKGVYPVCGSGAIRVQPTRCGNLVAAKQEQERSV